ncbi:MAG: hypothetical protein U9N73_05650 [Candidatus Auribacterota bacterium]|nr:hypothetical protein [Candidatus Auribacterota bacterium]
MKKTAKKPGRSQWSAILLLLSFAIIIILSGCASTDGGSSIPWAEPEPWEQRPNFGVQY